MSDTLDYMAGKLEAVAEFCEDLKRKGKNCRLMAIRQDLYVECERLIARATTYEEEARRLLAILENK